MRVSILSISIRDPEWSYVIDRVSADMKQNPGNEGLFERIERLGFFIRPRDAGSAN
jgi:hypothetical protein